MSREVHCADALDWLAARPQTAASFVTSLPDVCEVPLAFAAWRAWFIDAAAAVLEADPVDVPAARAALAQVLPAGTIDPDGAEVDLSRPFVVRLARAA